MALDAEKLPSVAIGVVGLLQDRDAALNHSRPQGEVQALLVGSRVLLLAGVWTRSLGVSVMIMLERARRAGIFLSGGTTTVC